MRQIPTHVAEAAEKCLNTDEGKTLMGFLVKEYGLMERSYIPDTQGKLSPINAAVRDGERGVVGVLFKLKQGEFFQPNQDHEQNTNNKTRR